MRVSSACLGPLGANCYLIEIDSGILVVDPAEDAPALRDLIGERSVDAVVLTHGHFDHVGGAWSIDGAPVALHPADLPFVDQEFPGHEPIERRLEDGIEILPGVEVIHLPGHSPGSVALRIGASLFVGDVLFAGSIGRTDLPGSSPEAMAASLRRLASLPGDYDVYPGHGPATTLEIERATNPYLRGVA